MAGWVHTASAASAESCRYHALARYSVQPVTARPLIESGLIELPHGLGCREEALGDRRVSAVFGTGGRPNTHTPLIARSVTIKQAHPSAGDKRRASLTFRRRRPASDKAGR